MLRFLSGFMAAIVIVVLAGFLWLRLGFVNARADAPENALERAPQFLEDAPDMPESQNFYIIQHGIGLTGMPALHGSLKEEEIWQVTTFLSHMDKLPPVVTEQWKAVAAASPLK